MHTFLSIKEFLPLFRDAILGLTYMHMNKIAHRDIKLENIMKFGENSYKLIDYGAGMNLSYLE